MNKLALKFESGEVLLSGRDRRSTNEAEFNLNVLHRLNREFDGNFDLANFSHQAFYDESLGRIEMR